jgi:hypothetical protein
MIAVSLINLAEAHQLQGDLAQAQFLSSEALPVFRTLGDKQRTAIALFGLGNVALARGDTRLSRNHLTESLTLAQQVGDKAMIASCLDSLAGVAIEESDAAKAARIFGASEGLRDAIGATRQTGYQGDYDRRIAIAREMLGESAFAAAWQIGRHQSIEEAIAQAISA